MDQPNCDLERETAIVYSTSFENSASAFPRDKSHSEIIALSLMRGLWKFPRERVGGRSERERNKEASFVVWKIVVVIRTRLPRRLGRFAFRRRPCLR